MKKKKDMEFICLGMFLGIILGIMFSPKSGKQMRKEIKNNVKDAYKEIEKISNNELSGKEDKKIIKDNE